MKKGLLVLVALLVIGGGAFMLMNKKDEVAKPVTGTTTSQDEAADLKTATATDAVEIDGMAFSPSNITVKKGTTVTWTNNDSVSHTVTSDSGTTMDSELLRRGDNYSVTFDEVGTFTYHCTPHPAMTGTVTVTE